MDNTEFDNENLDHLESRHKETGTVPVIWVIKYTRAKLNIGLRDAKYFVDRYRINPEQSHRTDLCYFGWKLFRHDVSAIVNAKEVLEFHDIESGSNWV